MTFRLITLEAHEQAGLRRLLFARLKSANPFHRAVSNSTLQWLRNDFLKALGEGLVCVLKINPRRQGNLDLIISQERIIGKDWLQQGSHENR